MSAAVKSAGNYSQDSPIILQNLKPVSRPESNDASRFHGSIFRPQCHNIVTIVIILDLEASL